MAWATSSSRLVFDGFDMPVPAERECLIEEPKGDRKSGWPMDGVVDGCAGAPNLFGQRGDGMAVEPREALEIFWVDFRAVGHILLSS